MTLAIRGTSRPRTSTGQRTLSKSFVMLSLAPFESLGSGPGWLLTDFEARWADMPRRENLLQVARLLEAESSIIEASAHLLAIGYKQ